MSYVLTPAEMREADAAAAERIGADALMQRAGFAIAAAVRDMLPDGGHVAAFAGPGNNGGDAFAALALLDARYDRVVYAWTVPSVSTARERAQARAREAGVNVEAFPVTGDAVAAALEHADVALDAMFGTGSRLPLPEPFRAAARRLDGRRRRVIAVDIPSGVDAETGAVSDDSVFATVTVALGALKPGLLLDPARAQAGTVRCEPIGIDDDELARRARTFSALDDRAFLELLPKRPATVDKRGAGAPLIVAGSEQFPGAAVLCAKAAARAGAGYVTVCAPKAIAAVLRAHLVEQIVVTYDTDSDPAETVASILDTSSHNSSIAIGPGLGLDDRTGAIVLGVVSGSSLPMVADASALFHFAKHLDVLRDKPLIVTPHAGEFARLSGRGTIAPGQRVARLKEFVDRTGVATLLKGPDTLIYAGQTIAINTTGTSALATAGSGDVLSGMIATLLAQGLSPYDAARAGAFWHGLAGQVAQSHRRVGVIAGDLIEALAAALPV